MSSGCAGFARDPAKVEDQVRFLARTLNLTLEPDGEAAACKAARSGFDSHRRLLQARFDVAGPAARGAQYERFAPRVPNMDSSEGDCHAATG